MHNSINQEELSALKAVNQAASLHRKPRLSITYYILYSLVLLAATLLFAIPATINPALYIQTAISPSLQMTDAMLLFIRIRGIVALILIVGVALLHRKKIEWVRAIFIIAGIWVSSATVFDFYRLYLIGYFTSTTSSLLHLVSRPLLLVFIVAMVRELTSYLQACRTYKANNEL